MRILGLFVFLSLKGNIESKPRFCLLHMAALQKVRVALKIILPRCFDLFKDEVAVYKTLGAFGGDGTCEDKPHAKMEWCNHGKSQDTTVHGMKVVIRVCS